MFTPSKATVLCSVDGFEKELNRGVHGDSTICDFEIFMNDKLSHKGIEVLVF